MLTRSPDKIIQDAAGGPPKPLREFLPFIFPLAILLLLLACHALLFWYTRESGDSGLYILRGNRYVEVLDGIREFVLGMSFLTITCFGITCALAWSLWQHKKAIYELSKARSQ